MEKGQGYYFVLTHTRKSWSKKQTNKQTKKTNKNKTKQKQQNQTNVNKKSKKNNIIIYMISNIQIHQYKTVVSVAG